MNPVLLMAYYALHYDEWILHVQTPKIRRCCGHQSRNPLSIPDSNDAEDVVQQALPKVVRYAERINPENPHTYILRVLDCAVIDWWRRRMGSEEQRDHLEQAVTPPNAVEADVLRRRIRNALEHAHERMSKADRTAFRACGEACGDRTLGTKRYRELQNEHDDYDGALNRARRKIRQELLREFAPDYTRRGIV